MQKTISQMVLIVSIMLFMFIPILGFAKERTIVELQDTGCGISDSKWRRSKNCG